MFPEATDSLLMISNVMAYFELRCGTCSMFYENIHDSSKNSFVYEIIVIFLYKKHHFWMYKILFSNKKLWTESKNVFWSLDKLDGHLMTFWWWSATTWWSRFWCFWSWFWITIWFGNAAIWLVRTSIIRLTTWSTTWSLLTSLFIFKSWFVALNLKILEFKYHTMTHNWWLIRMNYIWLTYLGGGVLDFFGCENS